MEKKVIRSLFCCAILATLIFTEGCSKSDNKNLINKGETQTLQVNNISKLNIVKDVNDRLLDQSIAKRIEINELDNVYIKELIDDKDEKLKNGVYGCINKKEGNYYIFINGVDFWYSDISFNIKNKLLTIKYNTFYEKGLRIKHLFLIKLDNIDTFDKVQLVNNNDLQEKFHVLYQ